MSNASQHSDLMVLGVIRDPSGGFRVVLPHGKEYVCRTPAELWADIGAIATAGAAALAPAPGERRRTHQRVRATPVANEVEAETLDAGRINDAVGQAGDVFEEVLAQEWGAVGRLIAQKVRTHGPAVARSMSPRSRGRGKGRTR